jgi:hypothetical protein
VVIGVDQLWRSTTAGDAIGKQGDGNTGDLRLVRRDRRSRGHVVLAFVDVIETDDGNVLRGAETELVQHAESSEGEEVVEANDGVGGWGSKTVSA